MVAQIGFGPLERIDGPLPVKPEYGLLNAATQPAAGVRIVPDADPAGIERWLNGVEVYPYPPGPGHVFDTCEVGSSPATKDAGVDAGRPQFGAYTVYLAETCTSYRVWDQAEFKARALIALEAVESAALAREFQSGAVLGIQPHLADGNGTFPNQDFAASPINALALLEGEIAKSGKLGLIHMSPMMATSLRAHLAIDTREGVVRTINGNVVINDAGYATGANPTGHAAATGSQEWVYATGSVDIRRTEMFTMPDDVSQALERGTGGASLGRPNSITYRAERHYLITWDGQVQAAVRADRCRDTC